MVNWIRSARVRAAIGCLVLMLLSLMTPAAAAAAEDNGIINLNLTLLLQTINFIDNQVNPKTGTLRVRGVFSNADDALSLLSTGSLTISDR